MFHCRLRISVTFVLRRFPPFSLLNVQGYEMFWRFELYFMRVKVTRIVCCILFTLALCNCMKKYIKTLEPIRETRIVIL